MTFGSLSPLWLSIHYTLAAQRPADHRIEYTSQCRAVIHARFYGLVGKLTLSVPMFGSSIVASPLNPGIT